jgi:cyclin-dependent kinase 10
MAAEPGVRWEAPLPFGACTPISQFEKLRKIGEGTYGSVYMARDRPTSRLVALKRVKIRTSGFEREGMPTTALREIGLLRALPAHDNVVRLHEVAVGSRMDAIFLVFEYCEHDVARLLDWMRTPFSLSEVKCLMLQLCEAVAHLHEHHVIHRDLKLSNLLLTAGGTLKLCDFGLARPLAAPAAAAPQPLTPKVVTLWYRAPELLLGARAYGAAIDSWALGCILGELLLHRPLMPGATDAEQLRLMCELLGTPSERIWPGFEQLPHAGKYALPQQPYNELEAHFRGTRELSRGALALLNALLTYDPARRASARAALASAFFAEAPVAKARALLPTFPTLHSLELESAAGPSAAGGAALKRAPPGGGHAGDTTGGRAGGPGLQAAAQGQLQPQGLTAAQAVAGTALGGIFGCASHPHGHKHPRVE